MSWERKDDRSRRNEELKELGKEGRSEPEKGRIELGKEGRLEPEKGRIKRAREKRMNGGRESNNKQGGNIQKIKKNKKKDIIPNQRFTLVLA